MKGFAVFARRRPFWTIRYEDAAPTHIAHLTDLFGVTVQTSELVRAIRTFPSVLAYRVRHELALLSNMRGVDSIPGHRSSDPSKGQHFLRCVWNLMQHIRVASKRSVVGQFYEKEQGECNA